MKYQLLIICLIVLAANAASWSTGPSGLSGWLGLPNSDILETGSLRVGMSGIFIDTDNGSLLKTPVKVLWGIEEDFEIAAVVPIIPLDDAYEGSLIGDISFAGGWRYETTRGGNSLKLTTRLTLPTGDEYRDTGSEFAVGGVTSTTLRDFRLSMAAEYALNGGSNPFDDDIQDIMYFTVGGSSFITPDMLVTASMNGSTGSVFKVVTSLQYIISESLAADGGFTVGLNEFENFAISAGIFWTGSGY